MQGAAEEQHPPPREHQNMSLSSESIDLARKRLFLGISNVGLWVVLSLAALWVTLRHPDQLRPGAGLFGILAGIFLMQALFDRLGSLWSETPSRTGSWRLLARGWILHTVLLSAVLGLHALNHLWTGNFCLALTAAWAALILFRGPLLTVLTGHSPRLVQGATPPSDGSSTDPLPFLEVEIQDPSFTGSWIGWGRWTRPLLPASWGERIPPGFRATEIARRQAMISAGLPDRSSLVLLLFYLVGSEVGRRWVLGPVGELTPALVGQAAWMTLWTFLGLLVLPSPSRGSVLWADRQAADSGHPAEPWVEAFPRLVGEDGSDRPWVQRIFYPIPSAGTRRRHLHDSPSAGPGWLPGPLARTHLYLSLATLTPLGRTVHCNVGRPALWIHPPFA
jgi:hypothetical protein